MARAVLQACAGGSTYPSSATMQSKFGLVRAGTYHRRRTRHSPTKDLVSVAPLLAKYLRLRPEWSVADPVSGLHRRSHEIAQLEIDFVEMHVSPFVDTQPFEEVERQGF